MMLRQQSPGERLTVLAMCAAEAVRLRCFRGTSLGRDGVPDVGRRRLIASGPPNPSDLAPPAPSPTIENVPAGSCSLHSSRSTGILRPCATANAGDLLLCLTRRALAPRSDR